MEGTDMDDEAAYVQDIDVADFQEALSEALVEHIRSKKLDALLECSLDTRPTDEFGPGASLFHSFVDIVVSQTETGDLYFGVLHPADDRDRCPENEPKGFVLPWDFKPNVAAKQVRALAAEALALYKRLDVQVVEYFGEMTVDDLTSADLED